MPDESAKEHKPLPTTTARVQTPRGRFISASSNIAAHRRIIDNPDFQRSIDVALLEHTRAIVSLSGELSDAGAVQAAAACFHLISGAHQFVEVFQRLAETPQPQAQNPKAVSSLS